MKNALRIIGILALIMGLGYLDRGFVDVLGAGALACLVVPAVIAFSKVDER